MKRNLLAGTILLLPLGCYGNPVVVWFTQPIGAFLLAAPIALLAEGIFLSLVLREKEKVKFILKWFVCTLGTYMILSSYLDHIAWNEKGMENLWLLVGFGESCVIAVEGILLYFLTRNEDRKERIWIPYCLILSFAANIISIIVHYFISGWYRSVFYYPKVFPELYG
ncbi:MAG: hypothetical protein AB3N64_04975 [Puniceicoccaceae bacterium]